MEGGHLGLLEQYDVAGSLGGLVAARMPGCRLGEGRLPYDLDQGQQLQDLALHAHAQVGGRLCVLLTDDCH